MAFELETDIKLYRREPNIKDIYKNLAESIVAEVARKKH